LGEFLALAPAHIEHTLRANRRPDSLYHAYNILRLDAQRAAIAQLYPMLEGQVAILSSGMFPADEAVILSKSLRQSDLYRPDQYACMLYPNRTLPGFLQKNNITAEQVAGSALVDAYYDIRQGLGFKKPPAGFGAFATDPYSHTPAGRGSRQPGMTGQVKEEILTRLGELVPARCVRSG
jgi:hypothetical protein